MSECVSVCALRAHFSPGISRFFQVLEGVVFGGFLVVLGGSFLRVFGGF